MLILKIYYNKKSIVDKLLCEQNKNGNDTIKDKLDDMVER